MTEAGEAYGEVGSYSISADGISGVNYLNYRNQSVNKAYAGEPELVKAGEISIPNEEYCTGFVMNAYALDVSHEGLHALMDLTGKYLTDFVYSELSGGAFNFCGWIKAKRADTGKYGVLSMAGDEVISADYDDITILNPQWVEAWTDWETFFYHLGDTVVTYMVIPDLVDKHDCMVEENYLNVKISDSQIVTFDDKFHAVAYPAEKDCFEGFTELSALKQKLKSLYGEETNVKYGLMSGIQSDFLQYWKGGQDMECIVVTSKDSEGNTMEAVSDKDGKLILPFAQWKVRDYAEGYFLVEKNKEIQLVRSDGAVTIEVDSQQVTRVPYGIALSCKTEEEGYFLLAADGVKTGGIKENSGAMTHVGKLWGWTNGNSTIEDLSVIDWHGNVLFENINMPVRAASDDEKFLLVWNSEKGDVLDIYSVDGASVDDVVATAN